jgi:squalene synthase HpnC
MTIDHYENFPVASILLPARLRPSVEAIYRFARSADDLADEGEMPDGKRLAALVAYENALDAIERRQNLEHRLFRDLAAAVVAHQLPVQLLRDLLSAFKQDIVVKRYARYSDLIDYCSRSANPVGRLMLHLYGAAEGPNLRDSDAICTALQLINFWQDIAIDLQKKRIYLPLEDLQRFGVSETHLNQASINEEWRALMRFEIERARSLLISGAPLALRLPGRIGWELRLVVQGGLRILECIEAVDYDIFRRRPALGKADWLRRAWRALHMNARQMPSIPAGSEK